MSEVLIFTTKIKKVLLITLAWMISSVYYTVFEYMSITYFAKNINVDASSEYIFFLELLSSGIIVVFAGLILNSFEIFYFRDKFINKPFKYMIIVKYLFYSTSLFIFIIFGTFLYHTSFLKIAFYEPKVIQGVKSYLFDLQFWCTIIYWNIILILTHAFQRVNEKYGQGVLLKILLSKYYKPKEEMKIFMFLDIKSSTSIAEKIGHKLYFNLLSDFFRDITNPIIYNKGEIYQYVGDEIVVLWKLTHGIRNSQCIKCFFDIDDQIIMLSQKYINKYGLVPEFKAGLHYGKVTVGEIGVIKKEIVYSGDVLNTTSRIQKKCNLYKTNLLISMDLKNLLPINGKYNAEKIGVCELEGKDSKIELYLIERIDEGKKHDL